MIFGKYYKRMVVLLFGSLYNWTSCHAKVYFIEVHVHCFLIQMFVVFWQRLKHLPRKIQHWSCATLTATSACGEQDIMRHKLLWKTSRGSLTWRAMKIKYNNGSHLLQQEYRIPHYYIILLRLDLDISRFRKKSSTLAWINSSPKSINNFRSGQMSVN